MTGNGTSRQELEETLLRFMLKMGRCHSYFSSLPSFRKIAKTVDNLAFYHAFVDLEQKNPARFVDAWNSAYQRASDIFRKESDVRE